MMTLSCMNFEVTFIIEMIFRAKCLLFEMMWKFENTTQPGTAFLACKTDWQKNTTEEKVLLQHE